MRRLIGLSLALLSCALLSCSKPTKTYETNVTIQKMQVVRRDPAGAPLALEVMVEYADCPGEQSESLTGNKEFALCMAKHNVGDTMTATVRHERTRAGRWDSEVERIGECARKRDPRDRRSYEVVQVCEDVTVNGIPVGFHCNRKPTKEVLAKCPWFER